MKPFNDYGSQNEETSFIRRVAAPDRPNPKRRQSTRLAMAGAALTLIGASAGVGYATLRAAQSDSTATTANQQMAASLEVPDFVESMGDPYYPSFDVLDRNGDGIVTYPEYMSDLEEVWAKNKEDINNSDLPEVVKNDLLDQLKEKIASDTTCVKKAMVPTKKRSLTFDKKTIDSLYYMLEVYCFDTPIEIPQKYIEMFPTTQAPVATPEPSIPAAQIQVDTAQGPAIVDTVSPVIDDKQLVTITTADGSQSTTTVDVIKTSDGKTELEIPTGPGGETTTVTVPTATEGSYANGYGSNQAPQVEVDTAQGPVTVNIDGPVIDDKQLVTITTADGSQSTTTVDVIKTSDGKTELEIPTGPGGETTTVTVPTSTEGSYANGYGSNQAPQVEVDTAQGPVTVNIDGPVIDDKQLVTITTADGSQSTTTVDVIKTSDGKTELEIPTGPGGETTTVTVPTSTEGSYANGYGSNQAPQVEVDTAQGPVTVNIDGPVIDDKQLVTITTADGSQSTTTVDVIKTSDGKTELEIPTGPGGETTTVTVPTSTEGSYANGYGSNQAPQVEVDTAQGPVTVNIDGPVIDDKQLVTITTADGSQSTTTVDVIKTSDGKTELEIPTGPGGETTTVTVPTSTEGSYANGYGSNQAPQVEVDTAQGPVTVNIDGPVIDDKQLVTITTADGSQSTTTVDVIKTSDGKTELEIPTGPGGETTTVTVPTSTEGSYANGYGSNQAPQVEVDTAQGPVTVNIDGPVIDDKQLVTITTADGSQSTTTVDVIKTSDGKTELEIPTGPGGETTTVTVPTSTEGSYANGYGSNQAPQVEVDTAQGPVTVNIDGPVIDDKQLVTITTADGSQSTTTVDVIKTSDGKTELEIPTGPGGETTTVTVPTSTEGSYANGYGSDQAPQVEVDTAQGPVTVNIDGPVIDDKQLVTITTADGSQSTTTVDVIKTSDGKTELEIPTGPGGETTTVTVPTATEGSYANGYGSNQAPQVEVDTAQGPVTVNIDGPVIDDKQLVTITTADGSQSTTTVDVIKTSDGKTELEIPTGPGGETTTVTVPTATEGSYANGYGSNQAPQVEVDTAQGPVTVNIDGPVIDDKQLVTITTADGSQSTTTVDVIKTSDGKTELEIPTGPGGETTTVTVPTSTEGSYANGYGSNQAPQVEVDTAQGPVTVNIDGPVIDDKQLVTITTADGSQSTTTVDVIKTSDGKTELEIPTGPGGETTTVTVPTATEGSYANGYGSNQAPQVEVDTAQGPVTVNIDGPVIDDKQLVTITTADGSQSTTTVDVIKTSDGKTELEIPTGPGGETTTVTVPTSTEGSYANGYGSNQAPQVEVDTAQGPVTVNIDGPVIDDKQLVTITTADGSQSTTTVDVIKTSDGKTELEIPTGPGGETTTVTVPTATEGSYANGYGSNQAPQVEVDTAQGPVTVNIDGPVIDDKQLVTITTADGSQSTTTVDVIKTSDGKTELEIPTGPGGETTTVTVPTATEGSYANGYGSNQAPQVEVDTAQGPVTVNIDGPVIDDKQLVTITTADGSQSTTTVDVIKTSDGKTELEIPTGPGGETTTVTVPTATEGSYANGYGSNQAPQVEVDTAQGPVTVNIDGPVIDDKQLVTITTADGSQSTTTVDVIKTSDGKTELEIPTGPGGETTTVTVPTSTEGSYANGYGSNQAPQVEVDTAQGPVTVNIDGPVIDDKQLVTITTADGSQSTTTVDVIKTSDGKTELEIPTGPGGETTTVTVPTSTEGSYANGYGSNQAPQVEVDTAQGPVTVNIDGPVIDDKQLVTITTADGSQSTTTVDVIKTSDGKTELEIPTGPGGETTTVTVPTSTEGSYANGYGSNQAPQVEVDTAQGPVTVNIDGPVIDDKQLVTITTADGSQSTTTVDVIKTSDGKTELEIPTGPGGETTTVTVPTATEGSYANGYGSNQAPQVEVDTAQGPVTVNIDGPVIDDKQLVTITTADGSQSTTTVDVIKTSDGKTELEIPTGPGGETTTVAVPSPSTAGSDAHGNQNATSAPQLPSLVLPTAEGMLKVVFNGPVVDRKASVTLIRGTDSRTISLDASLTPDGYIVDIPTGPGDQTWTVRVPPRQAFFPNEAVYPTGSQTGSQTHQQQQQQQQQYQQQQQQQQQYQQQQVQVETPQGPLTVDIDGPVIDDKQLVTITTADGSKSTTTVDVIKTSAGSNELEIPTGPGGETTTVAVPSPSTAGSNAHGNQNATSAPQLPSLVLPTAEGMLKVVFNGPVVDRKASVTLIRGTDSRTISLDASLTPDGYIVDIPTGPGDQTWTVRVPPRQAFFPNEAVYPTGSQTGSQTHQQQQQQQQQYQQQQQQQQQYQQQQVQVETPQGPLTVDIDGPVIDDKQLVTITTADGSKSTTTVDVIKTSAGSNELEIPTGPGGETTTVAVPSPSTAGSNAHGNQNATSAPQLPSLVLPTAEGMLKVVFNGPVVDRKASVTLIRGTDSRTISLDASLTPDGYIVDIPTGPGDQTWTVRVPPRQAFFPNEAVYPTGSQTGSQTHQQQQQQQQQYQQQQQQQQQYQQQQVQVETPQGPLTVDIDGPVIDDKQLVTITTADGSKSTTTVDVIKTSAGSNELEIPTGPGGETTTVAVPSPSTAGSNAHGNQNATSAPQLPSLVLPTAEGMLKVVFNGPVVDRKASVTLIRGTDSRTISLDASLTPDGYIVDIPTGPGDQTWTVRVPPRQAFFPNEAVYPTGSQTGSQTHQQQQQQQQQYQQQQQQQQQYQQQQVQVETPQGPLTVDIDGPVIDDKQLVTITTADGSKSTTTVDVIKTSAGSNELEIPTGPGGETTTVAVPSPSTAGSNAHGNQNATSAPQLPSLVLPTAEGMLKVVFNGPVVDRKASVTLIRGTDSRTISLDASLTPDGYIVDIPTGPGDQTWTVRVPPRQAFFPNEAVYPTGSQTGSQTHQQQQQQQQQYQQQQQQQQQYQQQQVQVETPQGPLTVDIDGPVIDDKQLVTITTADGSKSTTTVDVIKTSAGSNELEIPTGPGGETTTVAVPSPSTAGSNAHGNQNATSAPQLPSLVLPTAEGMLKVVFNGPVVDRKASVTLIRGTDSRTISLDASLTPDGYIVDIPTGPGDQTWTVRVPPRQAFFPNEAVYPTGSQTGSQTHQQQQQQQQQYQQQQQQQQQYQQQQVQVETPQGPLTVDIDGPVIDDKQLVTITTADGSKSTTTVDVIKTSAGSNELEIPTGPGGETTTVAVPSPSTAGSNAHGNQNATSAPQLPSLVLPTAEGMLKVVFNGPVVDRKASVTLIRGTDSRTISLDASLTPDGYIVGIPTGPGDQTWTVRVPPRQAFFPNEAVYPTGSQTGSQTHQQQQQQQQQYQQQQQQQQQYQQQQVQVETPQGPLTVDIDGPVIDDKQLVTITTADGSKSTTTVDVIKTSAGSNELEIPTGPGGETTTVAVPSPSTAGSNAHGNQNATSAPQLPSLVLPTAEGMLKVVFNGPVVDRKASVTLIRGTDSRTISLDASLTPDGYIVDIPTGPGDQTWTVRVPPRQAFFPNEAVYPTGSQTGSQTHQQQQQQQQQYQQQQQQQQQYQQQQVQVETPQGPLTVDIDGPVIDDKQLVTITTADGSKSTTTVDVIKTSAGSNELEIPTGPGGETTTVAVPSPSTAGSNAHGNQNATSAPQLPSLVLPTAEGMLKVVFNGPVVDRKASVTLIRGTDSRTISLDASLTPDGYIVDIPTGPGDQTWTVRVPPRQAFFPNEAVYPTGSQTGSQTHQQQQQQQQQYQQQQQQQQQYQQQQVQVETPQGPLTVDIDGPVIDDKQLVTITTADGSKSTTTVDVIKTSAGSNELEIPTGPGGETTTVAVPSPSTAGSNAHGNQNATSAPQLPSLVLPTAEGMLKVVFNGPVVDRKASVTLIRGTDSRTISLDASLTPDGYIVDIPTGPGDQTWTVRVPPRQAFFPNEAVYPTGSQTGSQTHQQQQQQQQQYQQQQQQQQQYQQQQVQVETPQGPLTVDIDGPVIDDKQLVTITTADGSKSTTTVDVIKTSAGSNELEIPTGPGGETTTVAVLSSSTTGSYTSGYQTGPQYSTKLSGEVMAWKPIVDFDATEGFAKVLFNGPVTDGQVSVTLLRYFGNNVPEMITLPVAKLHDGSYTVDVPVGPGDLTKTVPVPAWPGSENVLTVPRVEFHTPEGPTILTPNGPVIDGRQDVTITKADDSTSTTTVDVIKTSDGKTELKIPTGPEGETTTVTLPSPSISTVSQTNRQEPLQVKVDTAQGPAIVTPLGPVIDDKQIVSITTADGSRSMAIVDVVKTSDGTNELEIPTGSRGQTTTVTVPSQSTTTEGSYAHGYPSEQQRTGSNQAPQVEVDTAQGPAIVTPLGPVIDDKQVVSITTADGNTTTITVNVVKTSDGNSELAIPTGSRGETLTVTLPSPSGGGQDGVDNGDKDFMTKDDFQVQIGSHFSEKIMALKGQAHDEEAESAKILNQQQELQDCIVQAANKFGYYGVYEQAPHFQNAVDWVDNDCIKQ